MADSNTVTTTVPVLNNVTGNLNATLPTTVQVAKVISWLTFAIGLPAIGLAIYTLKNLSKGLSLLCSDVRNGPISYTPIIDITLHYYEMCKFPSKH